MSVPSGPLLHAASDAPAVAALSADGALGPEIWTRDAPAPAAGPGAAAARPGAGAASARTGSAQTASPGRARARSLPSVGSRFASFGAGLGRSAARLRDYLTLRPYGDRFATPAVALWLGSAWVLIFLMASIEGLVWGLVGATAVPRDLPLLQPLAAGFLFLLLFSVVWIVDASLIMSERPRLRAARPDLPAQAPGAGGGLSAVLRWWLGIAARVGIVAISLYVTAPFLEKVIRADDIARYHQAQVEAYVADRETRLQTQVRARAEQVEAAYRDRIAGLESEIARLSGELEADRARRASIEAALAPETAALREELTAARARLGDELLGRNQRPEGYGPEARRWERRVTELEGILAEKDAQLAAQVADLDRALSDRRTRLAERSEALAALRAEFAERLEGSARAVAAEQPEAAPPRLTFAARSTYLQELKNSPEERGVPHFETVEGFAQAALGILFLALIALKLFEPAAVRTYFNEALQLAYVRYREHGLAGLPGFEGVPEPERPLPPEQLARLWERLESDPEGFERERRERAAALAEARIARAEEAAEIALIERRLTEADDRLAEARERSRRELAAYERELELGIRRLADELDEESQARRTRRRRDDALAERLANEQWEARMAEIEAETERLRQDQAEARRRHALALEEMEREAAERRQALEQELIAQRERWERERREAEEAARRRDAAFHARLARADEALRLKQEDRRRSEIEAQRAHALRLADGRRAERRERIAALRAEQATLAARQREAQARRAELARELSVAAARESEAAAAVQAAEGALAGLRERSAALDASLAAQAAAARLARPGRAWGLFAGGKGRSAERQESEREKKSLAQRIRADEPGVAKLKRKLHELAGRRAALGLAAREAEAEAAAGAERLRELSRRLDALLLEGE